MATKSKKAVNPADAARRASRMRLKVVVMELKGIMPYVTAPAIDEETRAELERVITNQRDTLTSVLKAFQKPRASQAASNNAEPAHG